MKRLERDQSIALRAAGLLTLLLCVTPGGASVQDPERPLEEIVQHFAQKELEYATAHALYEYDLSIRIREVEYEESAPSRSPEEEQKRIIIGEFEQEGHVGFDQFGRRRMDLFENPRADLAYLGVQRIEREQLGRVPLFLLRPEDIGKYEITYITRERLEEVPTFLFRLRPLVQPRGAEILFRGIVWVDAEKLDIVRAQGELLPPFEDQPLGEYFRRLEIYREPVDDYLFTTYVRGLDILKVNREGKNIHGELIVRFSNHRRVKEPAGEAATAPPGL